MNRLRSNNEPGKSSVLDEYFDDYPSAVNAFRIFDGEWSSAVPGFSTGKVELFNDHRVRWMESQVDSFAGKSILEIGPLEGGHTYMLEQAGARVTAFEANARAYLKCLIVKETFGLRARFRLGDAVKYLNDCPERYDFALASGILYHLANPIELLSLMSRVTDCLGIWTHYYDAEVIQAQPQLRAKFDAAPVSLRFGDFEAMLYRYHYQAALEWSGFCGGSRSTSFWFTKDSLISILTKLGFDVSIGDDSKTHSNGPCLLLLAKKLSPTG